MIPEADAKNHLPVDEAFMREALREAEQAAADGEVPVGAILVHKNAIVASGRNTRERHQDPTAHAELIVIREAAEQLQSWRLTGTTLYVTLEPCLMCAGAMLQARIPRLVFGAWDPKAGACGSLFALHEDTRLNHQIAVTHGVLENESRDLLQRFFQQIRQDQPLTMT
ncbi:MAG: tRNA adenosine(34) deaminase TadA [Nitrospira sp.]|nr:tRNA adenosine(34) deaminase TadA [Nitrospira sp.]